MNSKHRQVLPADDELIQRLEALKTPMSWPWSEEWSSDTPIGQELVKEYSERA